MSYNGPMQVRNERLLFTLATIPAVDCILNQLTNAFQWTFGSLSVLEAFRGILLLCFLAICIWQIYIDRCAFSRIPRPALAGFLLLFLVVSKELVLTGSIASDGAVAYGQMAYWLMLWCVVSVLCTQPAHAQILLRGLAIGALLTALSVIVGFLFGGLNYYEDESVLSSSGWFKTAKMITGILVSGGIVILYLGRARRGWLAPSLALVCFVACILTYARAGTVAMLATILWLILWDVRRKKRSHWRPLNNFLTITILASLVTAVSIPTQTLFSRWSDVSEGEKAGSGRATIWLVSVEAYTASSPIEQLFGRGYNAMSETLFTEYGDDVKHTHNDTLDMVLVAGAAGVLWWIFFLGDWIVRTVRQSIWTVEGAAAIAILINYVCHAQFTGQLWGTDAMTYYVVSLTSLHLIGQTMRGYTILPQSVQTQRAAALAI